MLIYEPQSVFNAAPDATGSGFFQVVCDPHEAYFGYENLAERAGAVISATSEDTVVAGFAANAFDWLAYDFWQPTATGAQNLTLTLTGPETANYIGLYAYDFGDSDADLYADGALAISIPNSDLTGEPVLLDFLDDTATVWELRTNSTTTPVKLGVMSVGQALPVVTGLRSGFAPPNNQQSVETINNISQQGLPIGVSARARGYTTRVNFDHVPYDWIVANWRPFIRHFERKPFFFKWSRNRYPGEAAFCQIETNQSAPGFQTSNLFSINFTFYSLIDGL